MFDSVIPPWVASTATAWLLTYALHSTLLLSIAWLVSRRLAGRSPLAEEAVWRAAMVGALMTASLQVAGGWEPLGGSWQLASEETAVSAPSWEHVEATLPAPAALAETGRRPMEAAPLELAPPAPAPAFSPVGVPAAVLGLWLGGVFLVGLACARGYILLHRRLRHRPQVIGGTLFEMLRRLSGEAGLSREVHLGCSSRVPVPVALGGRRPEICLPPRALAALTAEQQEGMLAHELAHLVRRDPFWLAFTNLLTALFFFQPLQWVARRRLREISETLCDAWAVERTGRPLSLAQCLAEVAGWSFQPLGALPVAASMADRPSHLSRRIRRLLEGSSPEGAARRRWLAVAMGALVLAVAIAAPGVSAAVRTAQDEPGIEEPAEVDEDYDVDIEPAEAEEVELDTLGEEIERAVEPALEAAEVLADLHDDEALEALAELGELGELDALEDLGEQMAQLGEEMGVLAQAHAFASVELSDKELEEISRNAEKIAERVEALMGPEMERIHEELGRKMEVLHDQMPTAEMKRLEAEMEALAERMQPSDEEMQRLHEEIEKLREEGKLKGGRLSEEDRERIRAEARRVTERHRMSDEDREKMRELSRKHRDEARRFMEEHRDEIEAARRDAQEQSRIAREQFQRRLEEDPELRALRERHRQEMERYRSKIREDRKERSEERRKRGVAPVPPAPPTPGVAPAPRPSAVPAAPSPAPAPRVARAPRPAQAVAPAPPTPSAAPRPAMAPRPSTAPAPRALPAPSTPPASPAPAPAPAPAGAPTPEAPPAETPAPPPAPPEPPAEFV